MERVSRGVEGTLTLLAASAGAGKTALLSSWVDAGGAPGPVAWISLGEDDGGRARFWSDVLGAIARARGSRHALRGPAQPASEAPDPFLSRLINLLAELPEPLVLVLDDLHAIRSAEPLLDLRTLLRYAPPQLRLVLSTRVDPDLPLHRLRLSGQLEEIRTEDLAFTLEETTALLAALRLRLEPRDVDTLWQRTEGWAAGLRLAAWSLTEHPDPSAFVRSFAGDDRAVVDYLAAELLAGLPEDVRSFLLGTSIADRLCGELADALVGGAQGHRMLEQLMRAHAFVVALDERGEWYRYHHLLLELLRAELRHERAALIPELHLRAARWHVEHGAPLEAIRHAVRGQAWEQATSLVGEHWLALLLAGARDRLAGLLQEFPAQARAWPELAPALAACHLDAGELDAARECLGRAREAVPAGRLADDVRLVELLYARRSGDAAGTLARGDALLAPGVDPSRRALVLIELGAAHLDLAALPAARESLVSGLALARELGADFLMMSALAQQAWVDALAGRLRDAADGANAALRLAADDGFAHLPEVLPAHVALATSCLQWHDLRAAARHVEAAERAGAGPPPGLRLALAAVRATLASAGGGPAGGLAALDAVPEGDRRSAAPLPAAAIAAARARLLLRLDRVDEADAALAELTAPDPAAVVAGALPARIALARGDPEGAREWLASYLAEPNGGPVPALPIEAWVAEALAQAALGDRPATRRALERALELAEPEGYRWPLAESGPALRDPLIDLIRAGTAHRALAGELLDALGTKRALRSGEPPALAEPLTEREEQVLRYLPTMLSCPEIAAELYVSVNTVKTHLKSIYRKLGASGRRDAVHRARRLELLAPTGRIS